MFAERRLVQELLDFEFISLFLFILFFYTCLASWSIYLFHFGRTNLHAAVLRELFKSSLMHPQDSNTTS